MPSATRAACAPSLPPSGGGATRGHGSSNGGVTFSSQHNAEVSLHADNLWSWELDGERAPGGRSGLLAFLHRRPSHQRPRSDAGRPSEECPPPPSCAGYNVENVGLTTVHN